MKVNFVIVVVMLLVLSASPPPAGGTRSDYCEGMLTSVCPWSTPSPKPDVCKCFKHHTELCCNFHNNPSSLSKEDVTAYDTVTISNSPALTYWVDCTSPQQITLVDISHAFINNIRAGKDQQCSMEIIMKNSTVDSLMSYVNIELYHSKANTVAHSETISQLVFDETDVENLANISFVKPYVDHEDDCMTIDRSFVLSMDTLNVDCNVMIHDSIIETVYRTTLLASRISNSFFGLVDSNGLLLDNGWHRLTDVRFGTLSENALVINTSFEVELRNVSIHYCKAPCIVIEKGDILPTIVNINNETVNTTKESKYILRKTNVTRVQVTDKSDVCWRDPRGLVSCNLGAWEEEVVDFRPTEYQKHLRIQNAGCAMITYSCLTLLDLYHVRGYVTYSKHPVMSDSSDKCKEEDTTLKFDYCAIHFIKTNDLYELFSNSSVLGIVDVGSVNRVIFDYSSIYAIDNLEYFNTSKNSTFIWHELSVRFVNNLTLRNDSSILNSNVTGRFTNLTINMPYNNVVLIQNSFFHEVERNGICVVHGKLILDNTSIRKLQGGGINLDWHGQLIIRVTDDKVQNIICADPPGIHTYRRFQVIFEGRTTPDWLRDCTFIKDYDLHSTNQYGRTIIHPRDCTIELDVADCDMEDSAIAFVLGLENLLDHMRVVRVTRAQDLLVARHCFDEIRLHSISNAYFLMTDMSCYYNLKIYNSSVAHIPERVLILEATDSRLSYVQYRIEEAHFIHTYIGEFSASVDTARFDDVTLSDLKSLTVVDSFNFVNSKISNVHPHSVHVLRRAVLNLYNCEINYLGKEGFIIEGVLIMYNVTINTVHAASFKMYEYSRVKLTDVSIVHYAALIFGNFSKHTILNLDMENVTMAGEKYMYKEIWNTNEHSKDDEKDPLKPNPEDQMRIHISHFVVYAWIATLMVSFFAISIAISACAIYRPKTKKLMAKFRLNKSYRQLQEEADKEERELLESSNQPQSVQETTFIEAPLVKHEQPLWSISGTVSGGAVGECKSVAGRENM